MNHLASIWFHPKRTIAAVVDVNPGHLFYVLSPISWAAYSLSLAMAYRGIFGAEWTSIFLVGFSAAFGLFCGPLLNILLSYPIHMVSQVMGGIGSVKKTQACLAWSSIPMIFVFLVLGTVAIFGPPELFSRPLDELGVPIPSMGNWAIVFVFCYILNLAMSWWGLIILVAGISETEAFPKAWLVLLFPAFLTVSFNFFMVLGALST